MGSWALIYYCQHQGYLEFAQGKLRQSWFQNENNHFTNHTKSLKPKVNGYFKKISSGSFEETVYNKLIDWRFEAKRK